MRIDAFDIENGQPLPHGITAGLGHVEENQSSNASWIWVDSVGVVVR